MDGLTSGAESHEKVTLRARHYRTGVVERFVFGGSRLLSRERVPDDPSVELVFGPGFVDLQCNGYGGVDFNHPDTTPEQVQYAIRTMWRHGCTVVLPTVITAAQERMEYLLSNLVAAIESPEIRRSVPGFHVEGPFISPEDGARGAHPREHVWPPDLQLIKALHRSADWKVRMLTVAPEMEGCFPLIYELRRVNIIPAIGHTMADTYTVAAAAAIGAMLSTHLGNGCPKLVDRHANPIFAQLGEPRLAATVIPDGVHLPSEVLYTIARVKGREKTLIVTDAMAGAGAPPGTYTIGDLALEVGEDRVVRKPGSPYLAGSALTMNDAVFNFSAMTGMPLADAWDAGSKRPARLLCAGGAVKRVDPGIVLARVSETSFHVCATIRGKNVLWIEPELG